MNNIQQINSQSISTASYELTVGGKWGYIFRRVMHMTMIFWPLLYYQAAGPVSAYFHFQPMMIVIGCLIFNVLLESFRIRLKIMVPGHRAHELNQISSFAWGFTGVCLVLLFLPGGFTHGASLAYPIIASCAFGDPLLGELRRFKFPRKVVILIAWAVITLIWIAAHFWVGTPLFYAYFMAPLIIAAEWPQLKWLDDNFLMLIVPLLMVQFV